RSRATSPSGWPPALPKTWPSAAREARAAVPPRGARREPWRTFPVTPVTIAPPRPAGARGTATGPLLLTRDYSAVRHQRPADP
ncbi:hypothetical protein E3E14_26310, partial [Streptomyces sp. ICN441]